jgi:hypothetical protein
MMRGAQIEVTWWQRRSIAIQHMVLSVARAHQLHPNQAILLDGVDEQLFRAGMYHHPFLIFDATAVYLTPGSAARIGPLDVPVEDFELSGGPTVRGLDHGQVVVYQIGGRRLKAITSSYIDTIAPKLNTDPPRRIEVSNPLLGYLFGPGWYPAEEGFRWMTQRATLRMGGPRTRSDRLYLNGFYPPALLNAAPMPIRVLADRMTIGEILMKAEDGEFHTNLSLPDQLVGKNQLEVVIEAGRTFRVGNDSRELSLAFRSLEIR